MPSYLRSFTLINPTTTVSSSSNANSSWKYIVSREKNTEPPPSASTT